MVKAIKDMFVELGTFFTGVYALFIYMLTLSFSMALIYLLIIRPLYKAFVDKGRRLYWVSILLMLLFGLFIGPFLVFSIGNQFGKTGVFVSFAVYAIIIISFGSYITKREEKRKEIWLDVTQKEDHHGKDELQRRV